MGKGRRSNFSQLVSEISELVREDAEELGCSDAVEHARTIVERGSSAKRQKDVYRHAISEGATEREALMKVVDFLIDETVEGLE